MLRQNQTPLTLYFVKQLQSILKVTCDIYIFWENGPVRGVEARSADCQFDAQSSLRGSVVSYVAPRLGEARKGGGGIII